MFLWRWGVWYNGMEWMDEMCIRNFFSPNQSIRFGMNGWSYVASLVQVADPAHGILIGWESLFLFFGGMGMGGSGRSGFMA